MKALLHNSHWRGRSQNLGYWIPVCLFLFSPNFFPTPCGASSPELLLFPGTQHTPPTLPTFLYMRFPFPLNAFCSLHSLTKHCSSFNKTLLPGLAASAAPWELVRDADSQLCSRPATQRDWGKGGWSAPRRGGIMLLVGQHCHTDLPP